MARRSPAIRRINGGLAAGAGEFVETAVARYGVVDETGHAAPGDDQGVATDVQMAVNHCTGFSGATGKTGPSISSAGPPCGLLTAMYEQIATRHERNGDDPRCAAQRGDGRGPLRFRRDALGCARHRRHFFPALNPPSSPTGLVLQHALWPHENGGVDLAIAPITGMPRSERDAVIAARTRHVLAYDNLSALPAWLSDTLCRLSTGVGYATRDLYTNDVEVVIETSRSVILTGIGNPAVRGDLADRSLIVRLSPISDADRRTESELMAAFEEVRPLIFGALLDGLSEGLRRYGCVRLERLPRMADFCKWAVACEGACWPQGAFMAAYDHAQASATEDVIEDTPRRASPAPIPG